MSWHRLGRLTNVITDDCHEALPKVVVLKVLLDFFE